MADVDERLNISILHKLLTIISLHINYLPNNIFLKNISKYI